MNQVCGLPGRV